MYKLLEQYGPREFESPTRSTVPLLSLLKHGDPTWQAIVRELGGGDGSGEPHLEYTVSPPQGKGKDSHTDVMLLGGARALAIEAKWTEPRYATVGRWLEQGKSPENRREVLRGWLSLLHRYASDELRVDDFSGAVYQMVHRAASACSAAAPEEGRKPALAYLQFDCPPCRPESFEELGSDLAHLHALLGSPADFPFHLVRVTMHPTAAYTRIRDLPRGSEETAGAVREALLGEPLFEFPEYHRYPITGVRRE